MARRQSEIAPGVILDFDDVTGAYRIGVPARLPYRVAVEVTDSDGTVSGSLDLGDVVKDTDGRTLQFKRRNQSRSGEAVPIISVRTWGPA